MNLITPKTPLEADLSAKDARVLQCAEATHNLAAIMRNAHEWLWKLPTVRLLAILNADVAVTLATFAQNTALGLAANAALDALSLPDFPTRAPVEVGRSDITFDGTAFVFVPPVPEPPAEPSAD
jgi:hypothetical protein